MCEYSTPYLAARTGSRKLADLGLVGGLLDPVGPLVLTTPHPWVRVGVDKAEVVLALAVVTHGMDGKTEVFGRMLVFRRVIRTRVSVWRGSELDWEMLERLPM